MVSYFFVSMYVRIVHSYCTLEEQTLSLTETSLPQICRPDHHLTHHLHRPKHRVKLLCEPLTVCVDVCALLGVIEGQLPLLIVQVDSHPPWDEHLGQEGRRCGQGLELGPPLQPEGEVSALSVERSVAFAEG